MPLGWSRSVAKEGESIVTQMSNARIRNDSILEGKQNLFLMKQNFWLVGQNKTSRLKLPDDKTEQILWKLFKLQKFKVFLNSKSVKIKMQFATPQLLGIYMVLTAGIILKHDTPMSRRINIELLQSVVASSIKISLQGWIDSFSSFCNCVTYASRRVTPFEKVSIRLAFARLSMPFLYARSPLIDITQKIHFDELNVNDEILTKLTKSIRRRRICAVRRRSSTKRKNESWANFIMIENTPEAERKIFPTSDFYSLFSPRHSILIGLKKHKSWFTGEKRMENQV